MRQWPADQVERWPIERLTPYANNARLHSEADLDKIAAAIRKWGWTNPVLVDEEGVLIAGHGRGGCSKSRGDVDSSDRRARLDRGGKTSLSPGR
jgi:hypothetical protein